jgi:hypothetical protein
VNEADFYESLYTEIKDAAEKNSLTPFGLTPEEYAASIMYRCVLVDKLHEFFYPNGSPVQDKSNEQNPQSFVGGAVGDEEKEVLLYIQNEVLLPFLEKYFVNGVGETFFGAFLNKVYDGSFIPDYIDVLDELIGMNEQPFIDDKSTVNLENINNIKDGAQLAKNTLITLASKNLKENRIRLIHRRGDINVKQFKEIVTNFKNIYTGLKKITIDESITNIQRINNYVIRIFESNPGKEVVTVPARDKDSHFFSEAKIDELFCQGTPSDTYHAAQEDYIRFHFKTYLDLLYTPVTVPQIEGEKVVEPVIAPKKKGLLGLFRSGGGKTRRRGRVVKQRKSKRRAPGQKRHHKR